MLGRVGLDRKQKALDPAFVLLAFGWVDGLGGEVMVQKELEKGGERGEKPSGERW